jgi:hypothetical protein
MRCVSSTVLALLLVLLTVSGCRKPKPFQPPEEEKIDLEAKTSAALSESQVAAILAGETPETVSRKRRDLVKSIRQKGGTFGYDDQGHLNEVDLAGDRVSVDDALVERLELLAPLSRLRLAGPGITSASVPTLLSFAELEHLYLRGVQLDDEDLARLAALDQLRSVGLRRLVHMSDAGATALLTSPKLESVTLIENAITGKTIEVLSELPALRVLDLRDCSTLATEDYVKLEKIPSLEVVRLSGEAVDDQVLKRLAGLPKLRSVTLEDAGISDQGLKDLASLPLEELVLGRCFQLSDSAMQPFRDHPELRSLTLRDVMLSELDFLVALPELERLRLVELFVGPEELNESLAPLEGLVALELRDMMADDTTAEAIAEMKSLESLTLAGTQITPDGRALLEKELPHCRIATP